MALILTLSNSFILATKIKKNPTLHTIHYLRKILVTVIGFWSFILLNKDYFTCTTKLMATKPSRFLKTFWKISAYKMRTSKVQWHLSQVTTNGNILSAKWVQGLHSLKMDSPFWWILFLPSADWAKIPIHVQKAPGSEGFRVMTPGGAWV